MSSFYAIDDAEATRRAVSCDCLAHRHGNAGDRPVRRRAYPTDLTDTEWAAIALLIPMPAWMAGRGGRPESYCHREMIDAVAYLVDNGTKWRALPIDFPAWTAVYRFFCRWRDQELLTVLHDRLRRAVRVSQGREPEPTAGAVDSQSLRAAETVGKTRRGYDAGKKINGTKRHIAVDTIGLLLTVLVTAADMHDRDGAGLLLARLRAACPRIKLIWADAGYTGRLVSWVTETFTGLRLAIVKRTDKHRFQVLPRRWVVERTLGWITRRRRCVRDFERRADTSEAMAYWAMTAVMTRRLARR